MSGTARPGWEAKIVIDEKQACQLPAEPAFQAHGEWSKSEIELMQWGKG